MLETVFGRHWQVQLAKLLQKDTTTVNRWARGRSPPPHWLLVLVWALVQLQRQGISIPDSFLEPSEASTAADDVVEYLPPKKLGKPPLA